MITYHSSKIQDFGIREKFDVNLKSQ
uniref:Uncharacterized protein n=1 Tax=Tetranychus urticae TaxID=32264 RepID=T1KVE0_TETUR